MKTKFFIYLWRGCRGNLKLVTQRVQDKMVVEVPLCYLAHGPKYLRELWLECWSRSSGTGPPVVVPATADPGEVHVVSAAPDGTWDRVHAVVRKPWFIGTAGAVLWLILFVVVLMLWRRRRQKARARKNSKTRGEHTKPVAGRPHSPFHSQAQNVHPPNLLKRNV